MITRENLNPDNLTADDVKAFVGRYQDDPIRFVNEILQLEVDDNQKQILESIRDEDYVSIASGRGIGKSWVLSFVAIWVLCTKPSAKILVTSNTDAQSKTTLWSPLCSILRKSLVSEWFDVTTERINFKGNPDLAFIKRLVWSENNVEAVSGYHSKNMIYLCDESSKYPNAVLDNLYSSCTEGWNKMLLTSNPTRNTGYFYDTFSNDLWKSLSIDSRNSKYTSDSKIEELIDTYGEDSDQVRVQVKGLFPRLTSESILNEMLINSTISNTEPKLVLNHQVSIGIDVGGSGTDPTCFAIRKGPKLLDIIKINTNSDEDIVRKTKEFVLKYKAGIVRYDKTGLGHFLHTKFNQVLPNNVDCLGINFGEGSPDEDCFNMRSWIYRRFRDWCNAGGVIGNRQDIKIQIQATETYYDLKGKLRLIDKKLIKREIGHSPDEMDAIALSCAYKGDLMYTQLTNNYDDGNLANMILDAGKW